MKKYQFFLAGVVFICSLFFVSGVLAVQTSVAAAAEEAIEESVALADEPEVLDGVEVDEPDNIPSGFGLWWQNLRERIALGLTFNSVKKAEKQMAFSAERIKLAEYMLANSADEGVRQKAQEMLERAAEYMEKIQERQNEFVQNAGQDRRIQALLQNAAKNQLNVERIFEKLEDKLSAEKLEAFQAWREEVETAQEQLLTALKTGQKLPDELKEKAREIQARIENILQEREEFRAQQKGILDEIKAGREEAKAALEELRETRQEALEKTREAYKEEKTEIIERINSGEEAAARELLQLNQEKKLEMQKILQNVETKATEIRAELQTAAQQGRQELQQNRAGQRAISPVPSPSPSPSASL